MKLLVHLLIISSFICCHEKEKVSQTELTREQKNIIESLAAFADSLGGKSRSSSTMLTRMATIKDDNVEFLHFNRLDMDKFYEDPTPENLLLSLYQPDDFAMLVVREKSNSSYVITTKKQNVNWTPEVMMLDFGEKFQSIKAKVADVENSDFRIFQFEHLYFYTYRNNEKKRVYEDMRGNIFTPSVMCDRLLNVINAIKEAAEEGEMLYL